jgi:hypothetical protein
MNLYNFIFGIHTTTKQFIVSTGNGSLVPVIRSDTLCVIQKMTIFCVS